jgi:hypothetical protein
MIQEFDAAALIPSPSLLTKRPTEIIGSKLTSLSKRWDREVGPGALYCAKPLRRRMVDRREGLVNESRRPDKELLTKLLTNCSELHALDASRTHQTPQDNSRSYDFLSLTL